MNLMLTKRERQVTSVAADLLMKGNPCTRIAKYCLDQKMTELQLRRLLDKIAYASYFSAIFRERIINAYKALQRGANGDDCIGWGKLIRSLLDGKNI